MRYRALAVLVILAIAASNPVTASAQTFWQIILPRISFPAVQQVTGSGLGMNTSGFTAIPNGDITIQNAVLAPITAEIYARGIHVADLGPGGIYNSKIRFQVQNYNVIPLMAFLFNQGPDGKPDPGAFVGVAAKLIYLNSYYPTSLVWTISPSEIMTPSGRPYQNPVSPTPLGESLKFADISAQYIGGTTSIQIGNSSSFAAEIFANGRKIATLAKAGFASWEVSNELGSSVPYTLQINWLKLKDAENGKYLLVRSGSVQINLNSYGVHAYQIVIGPPSLGLRTYGE